jgi:hypothetical protein
MLPLFYTRQFLMDRWKAKRDFAARAMIYSADQHLFAVDRIASAPLTPGRKTLALECDVHQGAESHRIFLGLMETESTGVSRCPGIGICVDLQTGLVTDVVNDMGVLGYLEDAPTEANGPLHVRLEVETIGPVAIPRLMVGNDVILHPALYLEAQDRLSALVGTSLNPPGDTRFENTVLLPAGTAAGQLTAA